MESYDEPGQRRIVSVPSLTAWLSLCILAAAWGRSLDDRWQPIWADVGAYGLVASVGLSVLERARMAHQKWSHQRAIRARTEFGLARLSEHGAVLDAINTAIRRLQIRAACASNGSAPTADVAKRCKTPGLDRLAMEVTPIEEQGDDEFCRADAIPGTLRQLSARGVSFCHARPFVARIAVLAFEFDDEQPLSFVVEVLRTEASPDGFITHATVLEVGVPTSDKVGDKLAEPAIGCSA